MRKLLPLLAALLLMLTSCSSQSTEEAGLRIMAASFPSYDAARAVAGNIATIRMLVPPGSETHSYEPAIEDIIWLNDSDLFIYTGGQSDVWIDNLLSSIDSSVATFALVDNVPLILEESEENIIQGEEDEHDHDHEHAHLVDEHVWTSLANEIAIIEALCEELSALDPDNSASYRANADAYIAQLEGIRAEFQSIVDSAARCEIIVADRFPLLYFATEFGLDWVAAFPGCASASEPSVRTVASLIDRVREDGVPAILHMELSNTMLASAIAGETGAKVLQWQSGHNITRREFEAGLTYIDLMRQNTAVLQEALN